MTNLNSTNFVLVGSYKYNELINIQQFRSTKTGLTVVFGDVDGPLVHGYFALATEAFDDDGIPHALEHLIFLGSENYPYKGTLDTIANRCFASGTNAWTDTDHTVYTITTAGSAGLVSLLPVYLDHILYPILSDAAFITEVHHITSEGKDGGVVYCEMQGRETTGESLTERELLRGLYGEDCGYRYETGGILKNLRESISNAKIREYHKQYYRPENVTIIVTGQVKCEDILDALKPVEEKILSKGCNGQFIRPWQNPVPLLQETKIKDVFYPCDEEDNGMVYVGWHGPSANDEEQFLAVTVLLEYLSETAASPLVKSFVDITDPYCSEISYEIIENSLSAIYLSFEDVPVDKVPLIYSKLKDTLQQIICQDSSHLDFDMNRLKAVINKWKLQELLQMEKNAHSEITNIMVTDLLYSNSVLDTVRRLNPIKLLDNVTGYSKQAWEKLLHQFFISRPCVVIQGYPSKEEYRNRTAEEEKRIEDQRVKLGPDGLKLKGQLLEKANKQNQVSPPKEVILSVKMPDINDCILFHKLEQYSTESLKQHPLFNTVDCPVFMQLDDVKSQFIYIYVMMDSTNIPSKYRMYLPLVLEYILEPPIRRNGVVISHEDVVKEMEVDLLNYTTSTGIHSGRFDTGQFSLAVTLYLQIDQNKYAKGIQWLHDLLYNVVFTKERLAIVAKKIINTVAQTRRNGVAIVHNLIKLILFETGTNIDASMALRQHRFLTELLSKFKKGEEKDAIDTIREVLGFLTRPENMMIHMGTDIQSLIENHKESSKSWSQLLPKPSTPNKKKFKIASDYSLLLPESQRKYNSCIVGVATVDSAFFVRAIPSITGHNDPDLPALLVFIQYVTQLEGPLWRQIRGFGLAYGYDITPYVHEGTLYLSFYRSTDVINTYIKTKEIIEELLSENSVWDPLYFDSAKSSLIFEIIQKEKNISNAIKESLYSHLSGTDSQYNKTLVKSVAAVKLEDMKRIGMTYIMPLFDPTNLSSSTAIVCHSSKCGDVAVKFIEMGFNLDIYKTIEDSFLNPAYEIST